MIRVLALVALVSLNAVSVASAATFTFFGDPFEGSTAPATPGRQIVGGEDFISFDPLNDLFKLGIPGLGPDVLFANDVVESLPTTNVNVIVLRTFDNDANPATAFGAGNAANLIAGRITTPGAGLFIYFNSTLDLARLVYSADLDDQAADLKILFRMENLSGALGRTALAAFTAANFTFVDAAAVPEPATLALTAAGIVTVWTRRRRNWVS